MISWKKISVIKVENKNCAFLLPIRLAVSASSSLSPSISTEISEPSDPSYTTCMVTNIFFNFCSGTKKSFLLRLPLIFTGLDASIDSRRTTTPHNFTCLLHHWLRKKKPWFRDCNWPDTEFQKWQYLTLPRLEWWRRVRVREWLREIPPPGREAWNRPSRRTTRPPRDPACNRGRNRFASTTSHDQPKEQHHQVRLNHSNFKSNQT